MPYITQQKRDSLNPYLEALSDEIVIQSDSDAAMGDLNYCICMLIILLIKKINEKVRYIWIDKVDGVLSNVGREFYDRVGREYEDRAVEKNGDLPWEDLL